MNYLESRYNHLKQIVNFKKDLDWQKHRYESLNMKLTPSYAMQSYELMNKASKTILEIEDHITTYSSRFTDQEVELIDVLKDACLNVRKENREDAFLLLEERVNFRLKHFTQ